jgi:hypothetical protein
MATYQTNPKHHHHLKPSSSIDLTKRLKYINSSVTFATLAGIRHIVRASDTREQLFDINLLATITELVKFRPRLQDVGGGVWMNYTSENAAAAVAYYWGVTQINRRYFTEDPGSISGCMMVDICVNGNIDVIDAVLEIDLEMFPEDNPLHVWKGRTWIHDIITCLASSGHLDAMKHLIQLGAEPNILTLKATVRNGDIVIMKYLLDLNVIDTYAQDGCYPDALSSAAAAGNISAIIMLLHKQSTRRVLGNTFDYSQALRFAAIKGHILIVRYFLDPEVFEQRDLDFVPALTSASKAGHKCIYEKIFNRVIETHGRFWLHQQMITRYGYHMISRNPFMKCILDRVQ